MYVNKGVFEMFYQTNCSIFAKQVTKLLPKAVPYYKSDHKLFELDMIHDEILVYIYTHTHTHIYILTFCACSKLAMRVCHCSYTKELFWMPNMCMMAVTITFILEQPS